MDIPSVTMHIDYHQHKGAVVDVLFDADSKWLYTLGLDGNICQYAVGNDYQPFKMFASYRTPPTLPVSRATLCLACTMHGKKRPASLSSPNTSGSSTSFVSISTASPISPYPAQLDEDKLPSPSTSPASVASGDGETHTRPHTCAKHTPDPLYPHCLAVSDDGSLIATLGLDPLTVLLVDTKTMGEVQRVQSNRGPISKLYFSTARPASEIVLVLQDSSFERRCLQTGQLVGGSSVKPPKHVLSKHKPSFDRILHQRSSDGGDPKCTAAALTPKGRFLVTAKSDGRVQVWEYFSEPDVELGQTLCQTYKLHYDISNRLSSEAGRPTGHNTSVSHMCFSRKADRLVTVGGDSIFVWSFHGADNVPSHNELATDTYGRQLQEASDMRTRMFPVREAFANKDEHAKRQRDHHGPVAWHEGGGACRHHFHPSKYDPTEADSVASSPYPSIYSDLDTPERGRVDLADLDINASSPSPSPTRRFAPYSALRSDVGEEVADAAMVVEVAEVTIDENEADEDAIES
jgi:WD40 repeat protein